MGFVGGTTRIAAGQGTFATLLGAESVELDARGNFIIHGAWGVSTVSRVNMHTGYAHIHKTCANVDKGRGPRLGEGTGVIPRLLPDTQLELFPGTVLYLSQADAAEALGVSTRVIQYWETQGLLHPEYPQEGRSRRYTSRDLVEMACIKALVIDQGFTVPALKEKLRHLPAPYYYDGRDLFWDLRSGSWKSRAMLAAEQVAEKQASLAPAVAEMLRRTAGGGVEGTALGLLGLLRDGLAGRLPEVRKAPRARSRARRSAPVLEDQS